MEEHDVDLNPKVQKLAKTVKELYNRFKILHCQYFRYGKYENRNDLNFLLDEMLRYKFITQEDDEKAVDTLDVEMPDEKEPPISEDINDIIKSTVSYVIAHDKQELMELLEHLKKEVTEEEDVNLVHKMEKLV